MIVAGKERCKDGEFRCEAEGACIPHGWQCDGHNDCKDGLDETTCSELRDFHCAKIYNCLICRCNLQRGGVSVQE